MTNNPTSSRPAKQPIAIEALSLSHTGWSVIPLKPQSKEPLIPWRELQRRRLTEREIIEIFERHPDANVGVITGAISRLLVLDVDSFETVKRFGVPETPIVETARGRHYYFQLPGKKIRSVTGIAEGLDVKAEGGYVVSPPSVHPSGTRYQWIIPPRGLDPLGPEPAPPPAWLLELISKRRALSNDLEISRILGGVPKGQRNSAAASYVGFLLSKTPEDLWESDVWPTLRYWNMSNKPPLSERELRRVFEKIAERERKNRQEAKSKEIRLLSGYLKLMKALDISQRRLSKITGIPQQSLSRWFKEVADYPPPHPLYGVMGHFQERNAELKRNFTSKVTHG